ncbi:Uncharacterized protein PECH_004374 [Penicillium ucsense]|uniref:Uncharacterized protein n=1 Tax=Penicillium ucsense TaxID=2839758 RepID=A0A8J8W692_9EURO|nr:Uncharacterized protein PECM_005328 [Penicillium ucsense]KAF7737063.1 Uncharacterized protein PECH_004374 [Penicillium ucsense]
MFASHARVHFPTKKDTTHSFLFLVFKSLVHLLFVKMKLFFKLALALVLVAIQVASALPNVALRAITAGPQPTSDNQTLVATSTVTSSTSEDGRFNLTITLPPVVPVPTTTSEIRVTFNISLPDATETTAEPTSTPVTGAPGVTTTVSTANSTQSSTQKMTTSVIYTTSEVTITKCATTVTNCPADSTTVVTSTIPLTTTVCPVTESETSTVSNGVKTSTACSQACETSVPVNGTTLTTVAYTTTTVCPVTSMVTSGTHVLTSVYSTVSTVTVVPSTPTVPVVVVPSQTIRVPVTTVATFETTTSYPVTQTLAAGTTTHTITTNKVATITVTSTGTFVPIKPESTVVVPVGTAHASHSSSIGVDAYSRPAESTEYQTFNTVTGPTQPAVFNAATTLEATTTLWLAVFAILVLAVL